MNDYVYGNLLKYVPTHTGSVVINDRYRDSRNYICSSSSTVSRDRPVVRRWLETDQLFISDTPAISLFIRNRPVGAVY